MGPGERQPRGGLVQPPLFADRVRAWLGDVELVPIPRPHGQAALWSVHQRGRCVAWVKRYPDAGAAAREALAYEGWLPQVGWGHAPWIGRCPGDPATLATRHVAGIPATGRRRVGDLERLGELLAALHRVPLPAVDLLPLREALLLRAEGWLRRGEVPAELARRTLRAVGEVRWSAAARVPCHRDVQLHNLLVGDRLVLLDFGQARPDLALVDLVKLLELPDVLTFAERAALLTGAGVAGDDEALDTLARLRVLHGLGTWVWCVRHGDPGAERGRQILDAALRDCGA